MNEAEALKQDSMAAVLSASSSNWRSAALKAMLSMRGDFTGEDVRLACAAAGHHAHHPNAWGAFINRAIKDGTIEPTGRWKPMQDRRSHARKTQIYRMASNG